MIGLVTKIFSDFYYVKTQNDELFECKIREVLKKSKISILVGDKVKLDEIKHNPSQAAIVEVIERKNHIPRPAVANVSKIIVVAALKEPAFDYIQLNRYLTFAKLHGIEAIICVNKDDLGEGTTARESIQKIYSDLSYEVVFVSAKERTGIERLQKLLSGGISVLCGQSGVGKSSLLNSILPSLNLKTGAISEKSRRGTHTTRHTELIELLLADEEIAYVADTPGFSNLKFSMIEPQKVSELFEDIAELAQYCKYNDCLHLEEDGCNVVSHLETLGDFRYESYKMFLQEAQIAEEENREISLKNENHTKISGGKKLLKVSAKKRENSRKKSRQQLKNIEIEDYDE